MQKIRRAKVSIFIILFCSLFSIQSFANAKIPVNQIIFFGDSLSDNGNLYKIMAFHMPKSPPYFAGRFSNGYVWSEQVAKYFYDKNYIASSNYAVGGETATFRNPFDHNLPLSLSGSVDLYYANTLLQDRSHSLIVIWVGANDYLTSNESAEARSASAIANIHSNVDSLIKHGVKNILFLNLPDLSATPRANDENKVQLYSEFTRVHNAKLAALVKELQDENNDVNINLFDVNQVFALFIANVGIYNQEFQVNITDTTTSCWQGGYTLMRKNQLNQNEIANQLRQDQSKARGSKDMNVQAFAKYIAENPSLSEAYLVSVAAAKGEVPCQNADEHVFWDSIHPSATTHKVLAQEAIKFISEHYALG